ncbi:hypothetical protein LY78DRAFT_76506 [Colletotrichum sublineola]|nr:hypothetical protein LY78DRAFT_76506 [Colletotrichum sublineola]
MNECRMLLCAFCLSPSLPLSLSLCVCLFSSFSCSSSRLGSALVSSLLSSMYEAGAAGAADAADAADATDVSPTFPNCSRCTPCGVCFASVGQSLDVVRAENKVLGDVYVIEGQPVLGHVPYPGPSLGLGRLTGGTVELVHALSLSLTRRRSRNKVPGAGVFFFFFFFPSGVPGRVLLAGAA